MSLVSYCKSRRHIKRASVLMSALMLMACSQETAKLKIPSDLRQTPRELLVDAIVSSVTRQYEANDPTPQPIMRRWPLGEELTIELRGPIDWPKTTLKGDVVSNSTLVFRQMSWEGDEPEKMKHQLLRWAQMINMDVRFIERPAQTTDIVVVVSPDTNSQDLRFDAPALSQLETALGKDIGSVAKNGDLKLDEDLQGRLCSSMVVSHGAELLYGAGLILDPTVRSSIEQDINDQSLEKCALALLGLDFNRVPSILQHHPQFLLSVLYHPTAPIGGAGDQVRLWLKQVLD